MKPVLLHILQHSLGVDKYGRGRQYRNYYAVGPNGDSFADCQELAGMGLMEDRGVQASWGDMHAFTVTRKGISEMLNNSPQPPKLSKSKQRYQDFLRADCGLRFGEWLKLQTSTHCIK